jgi:C4-dicarboxylate-specific signal transduction histidine kinase
MEAIEGQTENERKIYLSAHVKKDITKIIIRDSGCGMSEVMVKNKFTPFFQQRNKVPD